MASRFEVDGRSLERVPVGLPRIDRLLRHLLVPARVPCLVRGPDDEADHLWRGPGWCRRVMEGCAPAHLDEDRIDDDHTTPRRRLSLPLHYCLCSSTRGWILHPGLTRRVVPAMYQIDLLGRATSFGVHRGNDLSSCRWLAWHLQAQWCLSRMLAVAQRYHEQSHGAY